MKSVAELLTALMGLIQQAAYYGHTAGLLMWDKEAGMPKGSGPDRDKIFSFMATKATETFIDPRIGDILAELASREAELDDMQKRLVRRMTEIYRRAKAVPLDLVQKWNETTSRAQRHWMEARKTSDFSIFLPHFTDVLGLLKERAQAFGYEGHPYNALVPDFEPGVNVAKLQRILLPLRQPLSEFARRLGEAKQPDNSCLRGFFPVDRQQMLSSAILRQMRFDFEKGRFDGVPGHPMTITTGPNDIRLTTRFSSENIYAGLFASIHEGGHGLYCQGMDQMFGWMYLEAGISI